MKTTDVCMEECMKEVAAEMKKTQNGNEWTEIQNKLYADVELSAREKALLKYELKKKLEYLNDYKERHRNSAGQMILSDEMKEERYKTAVDQMMRCGF